MARPFTPKIITANDLLDGDVIYMTRNGSWSRNLGDAYLLKDEEEAQRLLALVAQQQETQVGAYLADADKDEKGRIFPLHFREMFRAKGPSNYFHGKQAAS